MQLLCELIALKEDLEFQRLLEDLGNLKQLGLGRMVNAFKQTYRDYDHGRNAKGVAASDVGKSIRARTIGIGRDSEVISIKGPVKNWGTIKKAYRDNADKNPAAAVLYVDNKAVALFVMDKDAPASVKNPVGVSWDFTGLADEDDVRSMLSGVAISNPGDYYDKDLNDERSKKSSFKKVERKTRDYDEKTRQYVHKTQIKQYEGRGMFIREMGNFIDPIVEMFGTRLSLKIVCRDARGASTRSERSNNPMVKPSDVKLFKDELGVRLAKFKLTNAPTVETVKELMDKLFSGDSKGARKVKFAGKIYNAKPGVGGYWGSKSSEQGGIEKMMRGEEVAIYFTADTSLPENKYDDSTLIVWVKLDGMTIKPSKIQYTDFNTKQKKVEYI